MDILGMLIGLSLFLYGMHVMSAGLEKSAGNKLKTILATMTSSTLRGFFLGLGVTAIIQSSSATTVMVVGFVNSGIMNLRQAIGVILGANLGTSVTAWILSLGSINGEAIWLQMLKPDTFVPFLAVAGIVFYMFLNKPKLKDVGLILIGFATLMFGMDTMSGAVSGLKDVPEFCELFVLFKNPLLGVLVGAVLTTIMQSSSASVGILQALAVTGQVQADVVSPAAFAAWKIVSHLISPRRLYQGCILSKGVSFRLLIIPVFPAGAPVIIVACTG
jgi:phosphate:Na+ symporter